ncbi:ATP-binding protein [Actinacidiphila acidipaludis]|uniref:Tetratricopeptide repeat protein n=1 Tax=Actinacidiphila acidipaludis TaxID=2873382 RepID=A0ABS7QBU5_9ACTN|nr:XRE family transcriptional regulator [Streptomyces acidipaludis]MBY8879915.1 tetratricopeptide repeat protein [Streptomyces acidipaludis]
MPYWAPLPDDLSPAHRQLVSRLRALKDELRLTYQEMGRLTHYSHASWERWLNGKRLITHAALTSLLAATRGDDELLRLHAIAADPPHVPAQRATPSAAAAREADPESGATAAGPGPAAREPGPADGKTVAQLPSAVVGFAGREDQLRALEATLTSVAGPVGQVRIAVVTGGGGMGKTSLAVQAAHGIADHFPDGRFFADLGGTDLTPRDPHHVLSGWLRALGREVDPCDDLDELAGRWRSALHGRRALVLLDNAKDAHQVLPLLPAARSCAVLVTSRDWLPGIPAARPMALGPLADGEALDLLAARIGAARVEQDPVAAAELAHLCGGIPLAVQIAAARLTARPSWPVGALGVRLRDERRRLDELKVADLAIRAVFHLSYTGLPKPQEDEAVDPRQAFRLLGLAPKEVGLPAAAALLGRDEESTEAALELLVDAHLVDSPAPGRYRLHDLLRLYAGEQAAEEDDDSDQQAAVRRMTGWYLGGAAAVDRLLLPNGRRPDLPETGPRRPPPVFADVTAALAWCDQERPALVEATRLAARHAVHDVAWMLPVFAGGTFRQCGWYAESLAMIDVGLEAARLLGDRSAEATLFNSRSSLMILAGRLAEAERNLTTSFRIRRDIGDRIGEASTLGNVGALFARQGRWAESKDCQLEVLAMSRALGRRPMEANALSNLGTCADALGDDAEALDYLRASIAIHREVGDIDGEAVALLNMAEVHLHHHRPAESLPLLEEALPVARKAGDRYAQASILGDLGRIKAADRLTVEARALLLQAHALWEELGHHETAAGVRAELDALEPAVG